MKESTKHHYTSIASGLIGGLVFIIGIAIAIDAWATMSQIEAQGVLGQAAYQQQYDQATTDLQLAFVGIAFGFIGILNALVEDIRTTLWKLNEG